MKAAIPLDENKTDVCAVLARADVFSAADIKIYKSVDPSAAENISSWRENKLEVLARFHGGFHGHA